MIGIPSAYYGDDGAVDSFDMSTLSVPRSIARYQEIGYWALNTALRTETPLTEDYRRFARDLDGFMTEWSGHVYRGINYASLKEQTAVDVDGHPQYPLYVQDLIEGHPTSWYDTGFCSTSLDFTIAANFAGDGIVLDLTVTEPIMALPVVDYDADNWEQEVIVARGTTIIVDRYETIYDDDGALVIGYGTLTRGTDGLI